MRTWSALALSLTAALGLACTGPKAAAGPATQPVAVGSEAPPAPATPVATTPDAEFRQSRPPTAVRETRFEAPIPTEAKLVNGARLLVVENHSVPLVSVEVLVRTGVDGEPAGKGGLAGFTTAMLTEGTKKHPALAFSVAVEDLAAQLTAGADLETSRVRLNCLTETLPQALDLLAEALTTPAFRPQDVERVRGILLTGLVQKKASPAALAADQAARVLYGEAHPWGRPAGGTPETLKAIARADLVRFHETWYRPNNAIVSVSGDASLEQMKKLLDEKLVRWKSRRLPKLRLPAFPALERRAVTLVDKPGASQSQIWVVGPLFPATHPDRIPVAVANNVVGGLFSSRLNMNLREQKGYSYGVHSGPRFGRSFGSLYATGGVQARFTAESLAEYEKELEAFSTGALRNGELEQSKEAIIRGLPAALETNDAVASSMATVAHVGLPLDWYRRLPGLVAKVDAAEVARVARQYFQPERMAVIVVGPDRRQKIEALGLGPLETRPIE